MAFVSQPCYALCSEPSRSITHIIEGLLGSAVGFGLDDVGFYAA